MLFRRLFGDALKKGKVRRTAAAARDLRDEAARLNADGKVRDAVAKFSEYLLLVPHDVEALNDYGVALATIGQRKEAVEILQRAIALDDSHLPSLINFASLLKDGANSEEALRHVIAARIQAPSTAGVHGCYSSILFSRGDAHQAAAHSLESWLTHFNSLRAANQFLFTSTYSAFDEARLAAEHQFWADTLSPAPYALSESARNDHVGQSLPLDPRRRLRIGYWSPDLREHSVRFFFRPLIEGHDRSRVEITVFHDSYASDQHTESIKRHCDHFFDVAELGDEDLVKRILASKLDVLVELAGHTSTNRIDLLRFRLAPLQVSGLGYPPTTGLAQVDCKLSDIYISHPDHQRYYSERLAVLPESFWCFDPKEDIPIRQHISSATRGYVTFGCFGNIAKINEPTLVAWASILAAVPRSRLVLKATNFVDPAAKTAFSRTLDAAGIDAERVDLDLPESAKDLFTAYEALDIVLDTFPFNGGTTSCFATYMGIPVVTKFGNATASRMGLSVMANLGAPELAVATWQQYVDTAVNLAADFHWRTEFKLNVRKKYSECALGNGIIFASHFTDYCLDWFTRQPPAPTQQIKPLPAPELTRRARKLFRNGNFDAAHRVVDYCLKAYPECMDAHILFTERLAREQRFAEAASYLEKIEADASPDAVERMATQRARYWLLAGKETYARAIIQDLEKASELQELGLGAKMMRLACETRTSIARSVSNVVSTLQGRRIIVLVPVEHAGGFDEISRELMRAAAPTQCELQIIQCSPQGKLTQYREALAHTSSDIVIVMQPNVGVLHPTFFSRICGALDVYDVVSYLGADEWNNMDWRDHAGQRRFGSIIVPSGDRIDSFELQVVGRPICEHQPAGILEGAMLAFRASKCAPLISDDMFVTALEEAETLAEDFLAYRLGQAGASLGVHSALPLLLNWQISLPSAYLGQARQYIYEQLSFDPLKFEDYDSPVTPAPTLTVQDACALQTSLFTK